MNKDLTLGSLFDGSGGFPLGGLLSGITPLWASEVEPFPIRVTTKRLPFMKHYGDISGMNGGEIEPVDIITFGSPCTDMSIAGKRAGLDGKQSSLFYQAIRIIKEMRCATNGIFPVIAVWENVAGAFSSNHRLDFKSVLESFTDSEIPMPDSGRWAKCGMVRGSVADVCWRLLDAQYWGEPSLVQRRKRVFVVADFGGQRAAEILLKPRQLYPLPDTDTESRLSSAGAGGISAAETGREIPVLCPFEERRMRSCAKSGDIPGFLRSFGRSDDPFPTLLAGAVNIFSLWYEGKEKDGVIRYLTPLECERLMGLPDNWTKYDNLGKQTSDNARCTALGNAIALPCAEYIMAGIKEVLEG